MRAALTIWFAITAGSCVLPPSEVCRQYVACQNAYDPRVDTAPWDEGGACWTSPQAAARCDGQCEAALDALRDTPGAPAACEPP